ncbi:2-oxoglutarate ferredoxin oxidoreductase subunit alpha [Desulfohalotomaculum tongense]|uniref:2-oxoacid:acceptor oxidoreductase subunit alpha n=1 Tax=Desulforadius tongensis TaxID=1216062 RepID=UPI00195738CC|nr:2-oxoacid:acceptor oxidoreductase subunit alpha [Desulforadius tongensis]MBM7854747.1 2-oxoglutarate ferredoxin oxidoreductase subunit alpha [Desulforadius tongensis]
MMPARLMQGNEACAEGALAAGLSFYAGYPITPSTEITEILSRKLPARGGRFIQMEDEIASMAAVIGASLTGAKALTATSGPGFSLKQENIGFAALAEVPCVIINVQRLGPSTGVATAPAQGDVMQAKWGTHGDHPVIVLSPASVKECFMLTVRSFNLAERFRVPVIMLLDEVVGHMRERVELPAVGELNIINRRKPEVEPHRYVPYRAGDDKVPPMACFGEGYRYHVTGLIHDENGFATEKPDAVQSHLKRLQDKILLHHSEIVDSEQVNTGEAEVVLIAYGSTARSAARAVRLAGEEGLKVGLFRPISIWPFPEQQLKELARKKVKFIVAEMNFGQLALDIERLVGGLCPVHRLNQVNGELIKPGTILEKIREVY